MNISDIIELFSLLPPIKAYGANTLDRSVMYLHDALGVLDGFYIVGFSSALDVPGNILGCSASFSLHIIYLLKPPLPYQVLAACIP